MKTLAIIQARMQSSRLPGKVLLDLAGKPMLQRVIERLMRAAAVDQVVVATSSSEAEQPIADLCAALGHDCFRGSLQDVLDRYYRCALAHVPDVVVRITADCPLLDPVLVDESVNVLAGRSMGNGLWQPLGSPPAAQATLPWDFAATRLPPPWKRTYPIGLDVEVVRFQALETAWREAQEPHAREHVLPFLYEHPERFRCIIGGHSTDCGSYRWTVDTPEDLELVREIYRRMGRDDFAWQEVLALVQGSPQLSSLNQGVAHKHYREVDRRVR